MMAKLTEKQKEINLVYLFTVWFKSGQYNGINRAIAIKGLTEFMIAELNWQKRAAAERILWYFKEHQRLSPDELITIWQQLK